MSNWEKPFTRKKREWERIYLGKIIAIEVESKSSAGIGESLNEAYEDAVKKYPDKPFYFRKVGPSAALGYLF